MGDDSFDAHVGGLGQCREKLVGQLLGKISEELGEGGHLGTGDVRHIGRSVATVAPNKSRRVGDAPVCSPLDQMTTSKLGVINGRVSPPNRGLAAVTASGARPAAE